jgi:hypothetical protein
MLLWFGAIWQFFLGFAVYDVLVKIRINQDSLAF